MVAEAVEARKQIIPEALDQTELQVAPVIAKWLRHFFNDVYPFSPTD